MRSAHHSAEVATSASWTGWAPIDGVRTRAAAGGDPCNGDRTGSSGGATAPSGGAYQGTQPSGGQPGGGQPSSPPPSSSQPSSPPPSGSQPSSPPPSNSSGQTGGSGG